MLSGLTAETEYDFIYCYAEDDEGGTLTNAMPFSSGLVDSSKVLHFKTTLGSVTTLDEAPPSFTKLAIQDPTAADDTIVVTFALNEAGTAYCRAVRQDAGEAAADMTVNRILTAQWSAAWSSGTATIAMTKLENLDPTATNRDDWDEPLAQQTLYDVYCWAVDAAQDSYGQPRVNYMTHDYVSTDVSLVDYPDGGRTLGVWVVDSTPPTMIYVHVESITHEAFRITLQLDEPGTLWCQPADLSANAAYCQEGQVQNTGVNDDCYWEKMIKGNAFRADVHAAFSDVSIEMDKIYPTGNNQVAALPRESGFKIWCFAEDDWKIEADAAANSISYSSQEPNKVTFSASGDFKTAVGTKTTLDETPPSFTQLKMKDPTAANDAIIVTFQLNEAGTAYCRATRTDSGETADDMPVNRILAADWSAVWASGTATIEIGNLENVAAADTIRDDEVAAIAEQTLYDVYCWAKDSAVDTAGDARPNYMVQDYVGTAVADPADPAGGYTAGVWVHDLTPPTVIHIDSISTAQEQIQLTLQLNEPGTIWCQAVELAGSSLTTLCKEGEVQDSNTASGTCYFENFVKGITAQNNVFRADVHEAYRDVEITVDRIIRANEGESFALQHEYPYKIVCFAEDDWAIQSAAATNSPNFGAPAYPNKITLATGEALRDDFGDSGVITTLDDAPPSFTKLHVDDPSEFNTRIIVTFALNEAGTAYCRATRTDSGESAADMPISRIMTAGWSAVWSTGTQTIDMTKIESADPALTGRDDESTPLAEGVQYDVYCWAQDSAADSKGLARPQRMVSDYVGADVALVDSPEGGRSPGVWVQDTTPPTIIFVESMGIGEETIQLTLQLSEPGTIWCAAVQLGSGSTYCNHNGFQDTDDAAACYYETFIKGSSATDTVFRADAHLAYKDYDIAVNRILQKDRGASDPLVHQTGYRLYCYAEDDWRIEAAGSTADRSQSYAHPSGPNKGTLDAVLALEPLAGVRTTLDEAAPSFTHLGFEDPTEFNNKIIVTFQLNEAGTAYCRAARVDSGETKADMPISRILSAQWSAVWSTSYQTIEISQSENLDPALTVRDDLIEAIAEATQYDVYCWAQDSAVDNSDLPRPNYMTQDYVHTTLATPTGPEGGTTYRVWVQDKTPPVMLLVDAEAIAQDEIHMTLQLSEPGTLWCAVAEQDAVTTGNCKNAELQDSSPSSACYFETFIKGDGVPNDATFTVQVHKAYVDYDITMNKILQKDKQAAASLAQETGYHVLCFAEDDWKLEAEGATNSPNYATPANPNKVGLATVVAFETAVGLKTTLDETPPSFTTLKVEDPTASNDKIIVTFALNEAGTAYCRATRADSGETKADMPINRIITAAWSAAWSTGTATIQMSNVENVDPALTVRDDEVAPLLEAMQYDVYCWAQDDALTNKGLPKSNYMTQDYVGAAVDSVTEPAGGHTANVWVQDTTPPTMILVAAESLTEGSIQITLQLNEPGTLWCQAARPSGSSITTNCKENEFQDGDPATACYFERFIKGASLSGPGPVNRAEVHEAFRDVDILVSDIWLKDESNNGPLGPGEAEYKIFCFAEDDWAIEAEAAANSPNYATPSSPNRVDLAACAAIKDAIGATTTLDTTPPEITIGGTSVAEAAITVTLSLNEVGTAWCRAVRSGYQVPLVNEILETNFVSSEISAGGTELVVITAYDVDGTALDLGTDYDVYCYAEDDLCAGCKVVTGSTVAEVTATLTPVRTVDETAPTLRFVDKRSISDSQMLITLQVDEGSRVWCAAWTSDPANMNSNYEDEIKDWAENARCADNLGTECGSFWVYDYDDIEDGASDGATSIAEYDGASWKYNQDTRIDDNYYTYNLDPTSN